MSYSDQILKKQKYFEKTLSHNAIYLTWLRMLDVSPLFANYVWLQLSAFDLTQLGMGLLYGILPVDFEPLAIDFTHVMPTVQETLQGIWVKFEKVIFAKLYRWMTDLKVYILESLKEEFQEEAFLGLIGKAIYGVTPYGRGLYDPVIAREFVRSTFWKLRLMRTPDISWRKDMDEVVEYVGMVEKTDEHVYNRLMMIFSAQINAFVLGLSPLGRGRLTREVDGWAVIPLITAEGKEYEVRFKTLDHLQLGLILGVTPLGYGFLLPKTSIYRLPEGKKNPVFLEAVRRKIRGITNRITLSTWAYSNYNKPEEMLDYHKSERTNQYHILQTQRAIIEDWVRMRIPPEEANPVRIRQYQNAVLQAVAWRAKMHKWGFSSWKAMSEGQFKEWWKLHWSRQGLNISVLEKLYEGMEVWLRNIREEKVSLGERVRKRRLALALAT
jgi:hypothetical protein